ncbi:MAG TPA: hypothetical protein VJA16_10535 [Thermoanaerobaculia bacterium]
MPSVVSLFAALVLVASSSSAGKVDEDFLGFFVGSYDIVGRQHDKGPTYTGTVDVSIEGSHLRLVRTISGCRSLGTATLELQTADKIKVIAARFAQVGEKLEAWCSIGSDLDNYPRLTCLVERQGKSTAAPGMEAWFYRVPPP